MHARPTTQTLSKMIKLMEIDFMVGIDLLWEVIQAQLRG